MGLIQLSDLKTQARQRADQENSSFVGEPELTSVINRYCQRLYDLLVGVYEDYFFSTYAITTNSSNDSYSLPADFYKLVGVNQVVDGTTGQSITVKPYMDSERNRYVKAALGTQTMNLEYIPLFTPLVDPSDTFDGVNGYEAWVILKAASYMLAKEESSIAEVEGEADQIYKQLEEMAENRDAGTSHRVTDIYALESPLAPLVRYRLVGKNIQFTSVVSNPLGLWGAF